MNRRLFFITLLMLFCSTVFGQEPYYEVTNVNAGDYTDNMPLIAKVSFDGAVQLSDQLEVGVFCGDQLRASLFTNYKLGNDYYVFNAVWGKTGEVFTFKVYDHRTKTEWYYNQEITVKGSKKTSLLFDILGYGTFDSPAVIDFKTPPYYIPNTDASNSMLMAALVQIDGVEQSNGNLELGAFINDTVRGSARVNYNVNGKMYAYMQVYGKYGQEVTFKLYDHDAKEEVRFVTVNTVNFNEDGYLNFSNPLTVNFRTRYAHFDGGAYAAYAANKPREHFSINLYDVYASQSLVVKVYHDETLLLTTTYRAEDLDAPGVNRYPVSAERLTVNNVVSGKVAGSWLNEYMFENVYSGNKHFAVNNVPNKFEVYVDGTLTDTYDGTQNPNAGFSSAENLKTYLGFDGVYKAASVTRGEDVTYYMTLAEAFAAATQNGDIVTLYDNVTLASSLNVNRNVVLELNGYNIESNTIKAIVISNAQLTVNDSENKGVISAPQATLYVAENAKLIVNGGTIEGASAIQGNGSLNGTEVTINGGKIDGKDEIAIYHPQNGVLNIKGGTIVGSAGVEMRAGTLNMTAGTVVATGTFATRKHDSGQTVDGVAIALSQHTTNHNVDINITGGTIKSSANGKAFYQDRLTETYTPSTNITADIAATVEGTVEAAELGYNIVENNGVYSLVYVGFEAQIGEVKYETLVEAVEAAQPDATVILLKSATGAGVVINKDITIDFNGKTYTVNQAVGSSGTETLGFQILKDNDVTLKNGTLTSTTPVVTGKEVKMLIQNYANLTLTDMNLVENTTHIQYALSNNSGTSNINGATSITTDAVAFDVYDYTAGGYALPTVNVNTTGKITGAIEVSESISNNLNISGGLFTTAIAEAWCADGFFPTEVEIDGNTYYTVHEGLLGSGTETDPFIIRSLGELKFFRDHVNAGKTTYNAEGVHVALAANIDMATEDWSVNIGDDCNKTFDGIFDGKGYTISNLNGTETAQKADGYVCTGLFGAIYGSAVVKNLTIENVNITAGFTGNNAAAVVGFVYGDSGKTTTIENVTVKGDVIINASGVYGVGAIVGYSHNNNGTINIKGCKVETDEGSAITAASGSGAIIGYCAGKTTIDGCTVDNIDITGSGLVGGIAGITSPSHNKNITNNIVKNVNLTATKAEWVNSAAIAVGTMDGDGLTVANTTFENVNADRMVGSVYAYKPTSVVPAVEARIENKYYGTFDAALAAAQEGNTITVLAPVVITEDKTYDLTGLSVDGENVYPIFRIQNNAEVTVKGEGTITNDDYVFVVGASDSSSAGNLTIESGTYTGTVTVASVTKGLLTIKGGEFKVNDSEYGATYMINCIDANYNADPRTANVEIYGGTFYGFNPQDNAAETGGHANFCADGYGAVETTTGVWEVVPMQEMKLSTGWNWFSSYVDINGEAGWENLKTGLGSNAMLVKNQNSMSQYYNTDNIVGWDGTLEETSVKEMYMIRMSADHDLTLTGKLVDPSENPITLHHNGWTWIGYPMNQEMSINDALRDLENVKVGDHIKGIDGYAEYYGTEYGWWGSLETMVPGKGYMYHNNSDSDYILTYSYLPEGVKSELRANITTENNYWVPASSQYANNMNITAFLSIDGVMASDNYEVAAFVGGEVRGSARPIYVEPLDTYMFFLTVHGEDVEEMTFKCYDLATGEEHDLNNRMNYSNDAVVGSIGNPYLLSRGTTGIGESAMSEVNIYPNPTTTGSEVNLGSVCDTVEVFNALGVKVAEYQNVDTIDALETAGIYVIRITNNGNVQNCRLIVK